jgi:glycosyltransferase involved in cell wall biosynthesis
MIVGTLGNGRGGIHRYMEAQRRQLDDDLSVSVYDMFTPEAGEGVVWFIRGFLGALVAALRFPFRTPPDVVHVHTSHRFSFYRSSYYVLFGAYVWRRPVVLHVHGPTFDEFLETDSRTVRFLQQLVFRATDRVVVLSDVWRERLGDAVDTSKLRVLPNAVDASDYTPGFDADPPHVVFLSNLYERKGVAELVAALDDLATRDLRFRATIAGDGPEADQVAALAARHDQITYLGYVSEARKRDLLGAGSVFVLPTYAEGLPIAMLEGMAGGNAIVSTPVGSIPEVVDEGNGILVPPGDETALADALAELVTSPEETERMARRNRELAETEYSWSHVATRLEQLYESTLRSGTPATGDQR